jgi:hypothetical protein
LKSTDGKLAWYRRLLLIPWGIKRIVTWEAHLKVSIVKAVTGARSSWGRAWQRGCKIWRFSSLWRFYGFGPSSVNESNGQAEFLTYSTQSDWEGLLGAGMSAIIAAEENV